MRNTCLAFVAVIAVSTGSDPATAEPVSMTPQEARHLISRTGFGASPDEISTMTGLSYAQGVAIIMDTIQTDPITPRPAWVNSWAYPADQIWTLGQTKTELFFTNRWLEITELSGWSMAEMADLTLARQ